MGKAIVGTFNSEPEAIEAIDGLKSQGYDTTDILVMSKNRRNLPMVAAKTGAKVEAGMPASTVTDVMMDSFLTIMTGGIMGSHSVSLTNKLVNMGVPEFTAKQCESEIDQGKILVMLDTDHGGTSPVYSSISGARFGAEEQRALRLHEERIDITKERVMVGELQVRKEVKEEKRTVHVPVTREEVYVERHPVFNDNFDGSPITSESEIIRVPIIEERIEVSKKPVVVEEVIIGKRIVEETKQVEDIVRKEEARIERSNAPVVVEEISNNTFRTDSMPHVHLEHSGLPAVEKDKSIAVSPMNKKQETQITNSMSPAVEKDKSIAVSPMNKKQETQTEHSMSPAVEKDKSIGVSAVNKNQENHAKLSESGTGEEDRNAASANKKKK
ncbi:YsnF/AvaK domain-containing protein [Aneurinibacillus sp. Ricciae_BoGa-3]|uniref:YsnF/AvaK domain-containing protein n=1 Tax=Aneurinibacillus sp. Ricciae_BoGa-3 TaxID=3022697 RepID=UPI00233FD6C4|nr:YsnF/AvaK domain-containing protein [Aneurinibacillus sp. Ricciae_BoGa-3]WCK55007.1 YsnF/AvaK domain-containing protein [Aneurinibacillus sp. Ricciae_BoGa-3]